MALDVAIIPVEPEEMPSQSAALSESVPGDLHAVDGPRSHQDRYIEAKMIATRLTASLGLRGFRLNLAVESAAGFDDDLGFDLIEEFHGFYDADGLARLYPVPNFKIRS